MDPDPFSLIALVSAPDWSVLFYKLPVLLVLLVSSALVSGAEVAFFSLTAPQLDEEEEEHPKTVGVIRTLLQQPKRLLAAILVANNFINIAIVLLFASLQPLYLPENVHPYLALLIEVGLITGVILVFGEILPKVYANRNAFGFSKFMLQPLRFLDRYLLFFLTAPMSRMSSWLEHRLGRGNNDFSVDELSKALELTSNADTSKEEQKILEGIVNFGNTEAKEIMCPRIDMFALADTLSMDEVVEKITTEGYSRIPVYQEQLDRIVGVIYTKDLLAHFNKKNYNWQQLLREPFYVPENKKLDDLLAEFQQKKIHQAIVVDEYGGTSGLITLEDVIEEIVGDISDEFDDEDLMYSKLDNSTYVFDAKVSLKDFAKIIPIKDEEAFEKQKGESETLAGFLLELSGSFPREGQKISFDNLQFTVEGVDQRRIKRIKLKVT